MSRTVLWTLVFCTMLTTGFFGCRSVTPSVSYYFLSPLTAASVPAATADGDRAMTVGIRTVELPGYVNRISIVKRTGQNQMEVASFHRWADYPDRMVQRVLGDNLQSLMADAWVYSAPLPMGLKPDVVVDFTFLELIGSTDDVLHLSVLWTIIGNDGETPEQSHRLTLSEPVTGSGYGELAAAHSRALETLSRKVAESLLIFYD